MAFRRIRSLYLFCGFVVSFFVAFTAQAEERRVALVIGNSAYQSVAPLANPRNDATDLTEALTLAGFEVIEGLDLTRSEMTTTIREFVDQLDGASTGLFFYAGHGLQVDGRNYMIPTDMVLRSEADLQLQAIDMNLVLAHMERDPRVNIIMLDACRDNPFSQSMTRSLARGLAPMETRSVGSLIVYSTQPGAVADDGVGRNSPFTSAFLKYANQPGLEIQQMLRRVRGEVIAATDSRQVPWDHSSLTGDVFLIPPAEGVDADATAIQGLELSDSQVQLQVWNDAKRSGSVDVLRSFITQFPGSPFAPSAEARIRGLEREAQQSGDPVADAINRQVAYGVVTDEPEEPYEYYANARVYEVRGDAANAVRMYEKYLTFSPEYVDPHYQYQRYLRATEGRMAAREIYNEMKFDRPDDRVLQFAAALLQTPTQRKTQLEAFVAEHPDFAPALYALSLDFSQRRLGSQTTADKRRERELLDDFMALHQDGQYVKYFIDKPAAETEIQDAEERLAALSVMAAAAMQNPVSMTSMLGGGGFMLTLMIADISHGEIFIRRPEAEFESLGLTTYRNPMTGALMPTTYFELPMEAEAAEFEVKYLDAKGVEQGPYPVSFDPVTALYDSIKNTYMAANERQWVHFQYWEADEDEPAYVNVIFPVLDYPCVVEKAFFAIDSDTPDQPLTFAACDPLKPLNSTWTVESIVKIPPETGYVSLQVHYKDGEVTEVKRYPVKY
ncbi:MAG: caspase domain-containing protein [Pseudomonadota bacterium]